ncbi:MAG: hypothetical protein AAFQ87_23505, partial [Bacteroidota bacterium]
AGIRQQFCRTIAWMKRAKNQVRHDPALHAAPFPKRRTGQRSFIVDGWGVGWERALGGGIVEMALLGPGFCAPFCEKGAKIVGGLDSLNKTHAT